MAEQLSLAFHHRFTPDVRARLDAYVAAENKRIEPAELSIRSVINEALDEYLTRRGHKASEAERAA